MSHTLHILITRCNNVKWIKTLCCICRPAMADLRRFRVTVNARYECKSVNKHFLSRLETWPSTDSPSVVSAHRRARSPWPPHGGSRHTSDCGPQTLPQTLVAARHRSSPENIGHYFIEISLKYLESTVGFANVPDQLAEWTFYFAYIQTQYVVTFYCF